MKDGALEYYANTLVSYTMRGVHAKLNVIWDWEAPPGAGDTHFAFYRGTRARVEVRQTTADRFLPELYVIPASAAMQAHRCWPPCGRRSRRFSAITQASASTDRGAEIHVTVPDALRVGHEAHFAQVATNFLGYLRERRTLPAWEHPNMLAKYFVTTTGTELSRQSPPRVRPASRRSSQSSVVG